VCGGFSQTSLGEMTKIVMLCRSFCVCGFDVRKAAQKAAVPPNICRARSLKGWQKFLWQQSLILAVAASAARVEFQKHYK